MGTIINRIIGGNAYVDGTNFAGAIEEANLPDVNSIETEFKSMSLIGKMDFSSGIDKMESKLKWNSVSEIGMVYCADFYSTRTLMIRGSVEKYTADGGKVAEVPLVAVMRGRFKKLPGLALKQQDNPDTDTSFSCTAYNLTIDGIEIVDIDLLASVYRVDGVDLLAQRRANLGL